MKLNEINVLFTKYKVLLYFVLFFIHILLFYVSLLKPKNMLFYLFARFFLFYYFFSGYSKNYLMKKKKCISYIKS